MFERGPFGQFSSPGILAKLRSTDLRSDGHGGDDGGGGWVFSVVFVVFLTHWMA